MRALRKTLPAMIVSTITFLGTACERTATPTEPSSVAGVAAIANDRDGAANTIWVNDDDPNGIPYAPPGTSCNDPGYPTVQSAVDAAAPGDRINVCPGTYREQVIIPTGKDGIRLRSVERWQAIIKAPAVMVPGPVGTFTIVRVDGAQNVGIAAFTITGPGPAGCGTLHYGVRVDDGGSANILGNHITAIRDEPLSGCQNGVGIQVGRLADATSGSARIMGNLIDDYQKNGMTVSGNGSSGEIANNRVFGIGRTALIAQNGIQVSGTATANVRNNSVSDNIYTPQTVVSTGILLFSSGKVAIERNTLTSNDVGIYMDDAGAGSATRDNSSRNSTFDGIAVDATNGSQVAHNQIDHNGGPGIGVYDDALNNTLEDNTVTNNDDSGILLDFGSNNVVRKNQVNDNGTDNDDKTDGIRINAIYEIVVDGITEVIGPSTGNTISDNRLKNNVRHDCHDGSTGNTWTNNHAGSSFPPGLCDKDHGEKGDKGHTESLLQLQSAIRAAGTHRATPNPDR
jgi:parallel beta-helix repeat protein